MINQNQLLIEKFYSSFSELDAAGMQACYHNEVFFSDPVFPSLKGKEVNAMWQMLIESLKKNKKDWHLEFDEIKVDGDSGTCRWQARYTFSLSGRHVHNIIWAKFKFKDGKIIEHRDSFDFYRWAKMAFGFTGFVLGWMPFFKKKIQTQVAGRLRKFVPSSDR